MTGRKRAAALDAALRGMFKGLEARGVPEHVMRVVDQLDEGAGEFPDPSGKAARRSSEAPSAASTRGA